MSQTEQQGQHDFRIFSASVYSWRIIPLTQRAKDWLIENIPPEEQAWTGDWFVCNFKEVDEIAERMEQANLTHPHAREAVT